MRSFSYWESKYFWQPADHLIIGSGITGLTAAIFLRKYRPKAHIVVVERGVLPTGASTKNAGFACFGSASEILDDLSHQSENEVFSLVQRRVQGLSMLRGLLNDVQLGYEPTGGYEIFLESENDAYKNCLAALGYINTQLVETIGRQCFRDTTSSIGQTGFSGVRHMLVNNEEGLIDTGLMMRNLIGLARELGIEILTGVQVGDFTRTIQGVEVQTNVGNLIAQQVCVATNGFAARLLPELDVEPCRAQVLVTSPLDGLRPYGAFHHNKGYNYFRHLDGRILLGGGRHLDLEGERTEEFGLTEHIQSYLENMLRTVILPKHDFTIEMRWSGIMGMGKSKEVIIREVKPGIYCAVRFGGMGIALGSAAGHEVASLMCG